MFKKIVSNLPFSPALVGQLGFYAKRLRKEETTRRLGIIFIVLTLIVLSFAVFQPPESANASSSTDMVSGGIGTSINNFLSPYDSNTKHLKDVMNYVGITRNEIASANYTSWKIGEKFSWGFAPRFSYSQGERDHIVTNALGQRVTTVYSRPLKLWSSSSARVYGWVGQSKKLGWFAIMQSCGNLVTNIIPTPTPLVPNIVKSKTATNTSQNFVDASSVTAKSSDQISYTITVENTGTKATSVKLEDPLEDTLEYSTLIDNGGGTLNNTTKVLSWPDINLIPKEKQTRTFVTRLLGTIPATAQGSSDATSYDCIMTNTFGNSINIKVECPTPKVIENVTKELPKTGPTENIIFTGIVLATATYFYASTRQLKKEVRLIRQDVSSGTL